MKHFRKNLSVALSIAMILQMGFTPVMAQGEVNNHKTILSFVALAEDEKNITLPIGTTENEVQAMLPETLEVTVSTPTDKVQDSDTTTTDGKNDIVNEDPLLLVEDSNPSVKPTITNEDVDVEWKLLDGAVFSSETAGEFTYTATPSDGGYALAEDIRLPEINITVSEIEAMVNMLSVSLMATTSDAIHVDADYTGTSDGTESSPYKSISDALSSSLATENCTIKLLSDVSSANTTTINNISLTLDLNGRNLSSSNATSTLEYTGSKTLTVSDSNGTGNGILENTSTTGITILNKSTGGVTITAGTVQSDGGNAIESEAGVIKISDTANVTSKAVTTIVPGGVSRGTIVLSDKITKDTNCLVINGGKLGNTGTDGTPAIKNKSDGKIEISGGEISADEGSVIENEADGDLVISGGKVTGVIGNAISNSSSGDITISGDNTIITAGFSPAISLLKTSSGNLVIKGGTVANTYNNSAISNGSAGDITISGGTVSSEDSSAIVNSFSSGVSSGVITISGNAKVTSKVNSSAFVDIATIALSIGYGATPNGSLIIDGGRVENTGTGSAIESAPDSNVVINKGLVVSKSGTTIFADELSDITINGGAIVNQTGESAIHRRGMGPEPSPKGNIVFSDGLIWGYCTSDRANDDIINLSWLIKKSQVLPVSAAIPPSKTFIIPANARLTIPNGVTLTNNGTLKLYGTLEGNGTAKLEGNGKFLVFNDESITIANQFYTGKPIKPSYTTSASKEVLGKIFTVDQSDYTGPTYENNRNVGTASAIFTYSADPSLKIIKKFNILKSGTDFGDGIILDKADKIYTYGETITATVTPRLTGTAPLASRSILAPPEAIASRSVLVPPVAGEMALFLGEKQISDAVGTTNGTYTMTYNTTAKDLPSGSNTITAKFMGNKNMEAHSDTVTLTINKATITITAIDKEANVYDRLPALSKADYTVSGLVNGELLKTEPSINYVPTPNMSKSGRTEIVVSDAVAPDGGNYNDIVYHSGTLTISGDDSGGDDRRRSRTPSYVYYYIKATTTSGGSMGTLEKVRVRQGDDIRFTITPNEGYQVADVLINDSSVGAKNTYTFTDVRSNQTIHATFEPAPPKTGVDFDDVKESDWFYNAVMTATEKGWFSGTSETTFSPNSSTTRGMIATISHRVEGSPIAAFASFNDVEAGAWYANGVAWAEANGIVSGYGDGNYGPNDNITREQLASILFRYAKHKGYDVSKTATLDGFEDGKTVSGYATEAMHWAVGSDIVSGRGDNSLAPNATATRAEVASILVRFEEMFIK